MKTFILLFSILILAFDFRAADPRLQPGEGVFWGKVVDYDSIGRILTIEDPKDKAAKVRITVSDKTIFENEKGTIVSKFPFTHDSKVKVRVRDAGDVNNKWHALDIKPWIQEVGDPIGTNKPRNFFEIPRK